MSLVWRSPSMGIDPGPSSTLTTRLTSLLIGVFIGSEVSQGTRNSTVLYGRQLIIKWITII